MRMPQNKVVVVPFSAVAMHRDIVVNIRTTMQDTRVADLHVRGPSPRSTETFALNKQGEILSLTKQITKMSLLDFLKAYQLPFRMI